MMRANDIINKSGPIRILAVDDNPAALYATTRVLKSAGYDVLEARTGAEALAKAQSVDLVVLDINLPDIDGFEVCKRLRLRPETAQIPLLHLSATFTQKADFALGIEAGADSYLTRPVEAPVLLATVRTLLFAKHADTLRRGSDAVLRTMFELAPAGIAVLDNRLNYRNVNPAYCHLTDYSAEELIGRPFSASLSLDSPALQDSLPAAAQHAERWTRQVRFAKRDGSIAEVECQIVHETVSATYILIATDVTERRRAEVARESLLVAERAARAEAERSNRMKEEFLATLSHELRNPLHAIYGWATLLNRNSELPEPVRRGLQSIERNARIQTRLISDLLDYAGITFGRIRSVPEVMDPYSVLRGALENIAEPAAAAGVRVLASFEDMELRIDADPARFQQIALNLLTNAVKFSSAGQEVQLTAGRVGDKFILKVSDQGRGIDPQFLPRIFQRFSQQDATTSKSHGGLGLGLAIVKQLVEMHGGAIEASSPGIDQGATFTVSIPLSSSNAPLSLSDSQKLRSFDFTGVSVLIVDDDADSRAITARVLSDVGARVTEADSAAKAMECLVEAKPSLLISDIGMAHLDGYELLRKIRAIGLSEEELPAVALTAFSRMEDHLQARAAGFQEHLVKPLDPQRLISTVAALCRRVPDAR